MKSATSHRRTWKLNEREKILLKVSLERYTNADVAFLFSLDHTTVLYYRDKFQIPYPTDPVSIPGMHKRPRGRPKSVEKFTQEYSEYVDKEIIKVNEIRSKCTHPRWIKKCSCCGGILESDMGINSHIHSNDSGE